MDKGKLCYFVDIGLALSFLVSFITGILKWPSLTIHFTAVYRIIPMQYLVTIHDWSGIAMGVFVLIHLVLHWKWIVTMTKKIFKRGKK